MLRRSAGVLCGRSFSARVGQAGAMAEKFVEDLIKAHPVVVFSKSYCPFCTKAKKALGEHIGSKYELVELEDRSDCDAIQDYLAKKTGARSVPRVFVGGACLGGGDETAKAARDGSLPKLLKDAGAL